MKVLVEIPDNMIPALISGRIDAGYLIGCVMNGKIIEEAKHERKGRKDGRPDPLV